MNLENAKADLANLIAFRDGRLPALSNLTWYYGFFGTHPMDEEEHSPEENNYCGTSACAGGIMALAPGSGYDITWNKWHTTAELKFSWSGERVAQNSHRGLNARAIAAKWGLDQWNEAESSFYWRLSDILLRLPGEPAIDDVINLLTALVSDMEKAQAHASA